jgi:hypothetical protein
VWITACQGLRFGSAAELLLSPSERLVVSSVRGPGALCREFYAISTLLSGTIPAAYATLTNLMYVPCALPDTAFISQLRVVSLALLSKSAICGWAGPNSAEVSPVR